MQKRDIELFGSRVLAENRKLFFIREGNAVSSFCNCKISKFTGALSGRGATYRADVATQIPQLSRDGILCHYYKLLLLNLD